MPGLPVPHHLPEFAQTRVHWVSDAIQPSHPLLPSFLSLVLPASGCFPVSRLFASGGHSIGASASVLPISLQGWFPLGLTGLISLLSKRLSRVFSSITVRKYQFFGTQPSLRSSSPLHTWLPLHNNPSYFLSICYVPAACCTLFMDYAITSWQWPRG